MLNCTYMQKLGCVTEFSSAPHIREKVKNSGVSASQRTLGFLLNISLGFQRVLFGISVLYQRGVAGWNINTISVSFVSMTYFPYQQGFLPY